MAAGPLLLLANALGCCQAIELGHLNVHQDQIKLLPPELIYPFTLKETRELIDSDEVNETMQGKIDKAYAVHYFLGSWW